MLRRGFRIPAILVLALALLAPAPGASAEQTFTFSGSGWGHGLGMSQWGARGLAEGGRPYEEILAHYYAGTTVGSYPMPSGVRVGLLWDRTDAIEFEGTAPMLLETEGWSTTVSAAQVWSVAATGDGRFRVRDGSGSQVAVVGGASQHLFLRFEAGGSVVRLPDTGRRYKHGSLEFNVYSNNGYRLRAIAIVPGMERYLYGLGEVPSSWPAEALRTQAAAGRSYAAEKIERLGQHRAVCNCAMFATTLDQAYVGYDKETAAFGDKWVAAVNDTAGRVSLNGGKPIQAYYHSSNGGASENNEEVWGGSPFSYLRAQPDRWSNHPQNPNSLWTVSFSGSDLAARFSLQQVYGIDLSERTAGGGIKTARVIGNDGTQDVVRTYSGEQVRSLLGLRSIKFNQHQFNEFVLLLNPGDGPAEVTLTLMFASGTPLTLPPITVPARSRRTVAIDDYVPAADVAVKVQSNVPIAAERAMYFFLPGVDDGHAASGVPQPSLVWHFAEGATHSGFGEFLLISNPDPGNAASVDVTLWLPDGTPVEPAGLKDIAVGPQRRRTIAVNQFLSSSDVSATITAEGVPVVAERAMYFAVKDGAGYPLVDGGSVSEGATAPAPTWYLAEGATHSGFSTFVLVHNPNAEQVDVALDLYTPSGLEKTIERKMPGHSRLTVSLNAEVPGMDVSTRVRSLTGGKGVVAERAVYFLQGLLDGGTAALGVTAPAATWYLAEGATHSGYSTFVLVQNPNAEKVSVRFELLTPAGLAKTIDREMPGHSRLTVSLNAELPGQDVSTVVRSLPEGKGVVVERAVYFGGRGIDGGHAAPGVPNLSTTWYFAEGFTGP